MLSKRFYGIALVLLILIASFNFFGCSAVSEKSGSEAIVVWHWMTDRDDALLELAKKYKENTGIEVKFELYAPSEAYSQKVRAAAQANNLPDIFGVLGERRDFASFIKSGHISNLSYYMNADNGKWRNKFFAKALQMNEFLPYNDFQVDPGIYGVPLDVTNIELLYNKDLFKKAGLNPNRPPVTWEEFIKCGITLKEAGISGLVSGWGEIWMIDCLASNFAWNIMGEEKVINTIKGSVAYTDPDWIKVFDLFREMRDAGMYASGIVTMVNKEAEQTFANQRAAFAFNGSWCVNVYYGMNPDLNYGAFLPPRVSNDYPVTIWGGAGSSFMVNANSANKEGAINFLMWLSDADQQVYLSEKTNNLPANKDSIRNIPPILKEFAQNMDDTIHPSLLPVAEDPRVVEAFDKGIQSIIIGEKTPQQVADEVQQLKERIIERGR